MPEMFGANPARLHVVPNGVDEVFFLKREGGSVKPENKMPAQPGESFKSQVSGLRFPEREDYLVCTATITERKRVVELAEAAVLAGTPVWIVGKPYAERDPYYLRFQEIQRRNPGIVRYEGPVTDRSQLAAIYQRARGFVLLSTMESLSLSALEAAAARCPLLLSDLPWARCTFADAASYCPVGGSKEATATVLRRFHEAAPNLPVPPKPETWREVAMQLKGIYEEILQR